MTGTAEAPASDAPRARYDRAEARHAAAAEALARRSRALGAGRVATFSAGLLAAVLVFDLPLSFAVTWSFVGLCLAAFALLVARHRRVRADLHREEAGLRFARAGRARLDRDFERLAELREEGGDELPDLDANRVPIPDHPWVEDLDLRGPRGVRALLGPTPSPTGQRTLRRWLEEVPEAPEELPARQGGVRALAHDFDRRADLQIEAALVPTVSPRSWDRFRSWLSDPSLFDPMPGGDDAGGGDRLPPWFRGLDRILPPITLGVAALALGGVAPIPNLVWGVLLLVQAGIAWRTQGAVTRLFTGLGLGAGGLRRYDRLLAAWEAVGIDDPWIRERSGGLEGAPEAIRELERRLDMAESRASMFYAFFAVALLWDLRTARTLEGWRARHRDRVPGWFDRLGELEAASALATLAHDHPDWCFPEIDTDPASVPGFAAEALGHPLLDPRVRRTNDLTLDPPGRFLLVTGSNMSGKSTLLRSIGLAVVLGNAGAPVCAARCRMTPLAPFTSMRLADSLSSGVSLFMAELQRLKALVDAAPPAGSDRPALLYLVDEVLQGTNSEERRIAARRIILHLLGRRAIGAVTTHDLALHEAPRLDAASTKVHFRETVGGEGEAVLSFDYRLREGLATSRNALRLLEVVGLATDDEDDGDQRTTP